MSSKFPFYVDRKNFLPSNVLNFKPHQNFIYGDSELRFNQNLITQPLDWHYRTKTVEYILNSDGYRTKEWDCINWKESIVIFGCSQVFGIAVDETETISYNLSQLTGRDVINLGQPGTSIYYSIYNSIILKNIAPTPWAVIQLWTAPDRMTISGNTSLMHEGSWSKEKIWKLWNQYEFNNGFHLHFLKEADRLLWKSTRYFTGAMLQRQCSANKEEPTFIPIDHGRDLGHLGPKSTQLIAKQIYNNIMPTSSNG